MSDLFGSIKSDLLGRRMLPFLAVLGVALVAALGYAVLAGKASAPKPAAGLGAGESPPAIPGPQVSAAQPSTNAAVAETTATVGSLHHGSTRDPFKPLPGSGSQNNSSSSGAGGKAGSSSSSSSSSSSGHSSESGKAGSQPAHSSPSPSSAPAPSPSKVAAPKPKPKEPVYEVDVTFGLHMSASQTQAPQTYKDLKRLQPLPSSQSPRVAFMGVSSTGKGAIFSLISEPILQGDGACVPSPSQCEAIDLGVGKSEELSYVEPDGQSTVYQLQVVSITKSEQLAVAARKADATVSEAGHELLASGQLPALGDMRFSLGQDVLVLRSARPSRAASSRHSR